MGMFNLKDPNSAESNTGVCPECGTVRYTMEPRCPQCGSMELPVHTWKMAPKKKK